jgi:integrase
MSQAAPTAANRTLPLRRPNAAYRQREYLTEAEVEKLIDAARKRSRSPERDAALLAYRHGLRAAELTSLRWSAIDLTHGRMHVNRAIHGAGTGSICEVLAGLALRATGASLLRWRRAALFIPHATLERSTSCPAIGAFLFSALDAGCFAAAGNCKTAASWSSSRYVSRTISPSGNSRAS